MILPSSSCFVTHEFKCELMRIVLLSYRIVICAKCRPTLLNVYIIIVTAFHLFTYAVVISDSKMMSIIARFRVNVYHRARRSFTAHSWNITWHWNSYHNLHYSRDRLLLLPSLPCVWQVL